MSELTLTILRLGLLVLLWLFVFSLAGVLPATGGPRNLVVTSGPLEGTRIPLGDNDILIGRNSDCLLVLDDDFASGRHAAFVRTPDGWAVEDLGSTNGTFVDGERIAELVGIAPGNEVQIGRTTIELQK